MKLDLTQPLRASVKEALGRKFKEKAAYSLIRPSAVGRKLQQGFKSAGELDGSLGEKFIIMEAPNARAA